MFATSFVLQDHETPTNRSFHKSIKMVVKYGLKDVIGDLKARPMEHAESWQAKWRQFCADMVKPKIPPYPCLTSVARFLQAWRPGIHQCVSHSSRCPWCQQKKDGSMTS